MAKRDRKGTAIYVPDDVGMHEMLEELSEYMAEEEDRPRVPYWEVVYKSLKEALEVRR